MLTAFHHLKLVTDGSIYPSKAVLVDDEMIVGVVDDQNIPAEARMIDLQGAYLAPGFIDIQIYSSGSPLFFGGNPSVAALAQMETSLLRQGCTGFLATIATNTDAVVEAGIQAMLDYRQQKKGNLLGLHLEGPFINPKRKGAHPENLIKPATLQQLKSWVEMADGELKMMTLAPELQDDEILNYLNSQSIIVSLGHSDATYRQAKSYLNNQVQAVTHLYNAMPPMHHRNPGIIPAVFEEKPYTSIIADGIHVDFAMIALAKRELGEKLFLITDAVTQSEDGVYRHQFHQNRYTMPDGTLSGSCITLLKSVANMINHTSTSLAEAVNMATLYPARLLKADHRLGKVQQGYIANMVAFNSNFEWQGTVMLGNYLTNTI